MNIGVDIDEVVAEFVKGYLNLYNQRYKRNVRFEEITSYYLWVPLEISRYEAFNLASDYFHSKEFDNIDIVEGAREGLEKISRGNNLFFITSRPIYTKVKTEKFFTRNFPNINGEIYYSGDIFFIQGKRKAELCSELEIDYLIEDSEKYALECAGKGTSVFLLDKPWNQKAINNGIIKRVKSWEEIIL